jgi:protein-L-isoaspartate(D-aspartate) O-methyltransferase
MNFAVARQMMVDGQVRTNDVTDARVLGAMLELPREKFVPGAYQSMAYLDMDVPVSQVGRGEAVRCLLKPMVLARLVQAAGVRPGEHVLDVGCTTGYSSALLARLAGAVVGLEEDPILAALAMQALDGIGAANVKVVTGVLTEGWRAGAPYNVILLNGATEVAPRGLFAQLADGGRLVGIEGCGPAGRAMLYRSVAGEVSGWPVFDAAAAIIPGFAAPPTFVF